MNIAPLFQWCHLCLQTRTERAAFPISPPTCRFNIPSHCRAVYIPTTCPFPPPYFCTASVGVYARARLVAVGAYHICTTGSACRTVCSRHLAPCPVPLPYLRCHAAVPTPRSATTDWITALPTVRLILPFRHPMPAYLARPAFASVPTGFYILPVGLFRRRLPAHYRFPTAPTTPPYPAVLHLPVVSYRLRASMAAGSAIIRKEKA